MRAEVEGRVEEGVSEVVSEEESLQISSETQGEEVNMTEEGASGANPSENPLMAMQAMMQSVMKTMTEQQNKLIESLAERQSRDNLARIEADRVREEARLEAERVREEIRLEAERQREERSRTSRADAERERDERTRLNKEEERKYRKKQDELKDRWMSFSSFKEGGDLNSFLARFEHVMKSCEVEEGLWTTKLYSRLNITLCSRMKPMLDGGAEYGVVKTLLLESVGATVATYGKKLYEVTMESLKAMTAIQMIEHLSGIAQGLMQEAKDLKDVIFVLVKMMVRHCLPHNGIVFLEGKEVNNLEQLRKALEAWLSTRMDGDFTKIPGQSAVTSQLAVVHTLEVRVSPVVECVGRLAIRVRCVGIRKRSPAVIAVVVQSAQGTSQNP